MKHLLLFGMLYLLAFPVFGATIFVKEGMKGTGNSWSDATGDLAVALVKANSGDQIWVAKGIYFPSSENNRRKSFTVPAGVQLLGGFAGFENSPEQRDIPNNKTILSGNIGSISDAEDNSYTVTYLKNASALTIIDGFIIADGNSTGKGTTAEMDSSGGAMYIDGSGGAASPIIKNCIFQQNRARNGGAVFINGRKGICKPSFLNCQFLNNQAELDGGAIFNDGSQLGEASPELRHCIFNNNQSHFGGAICNYGGNGNSSPLIQTCVFRSNEAVLRGGAIFNMDADGVAQPKINNCQFVDNEAITGKGVYTYSKYLNQEKVNEPILYKFN